MTIFYTEIYYAGAKKLCKAASRLLNTPKPFTQIKKPLRFAAALLSFVFFAMPAAAQTLSFSYTGPNAYQTNTAITPLTPAQTVNSSVFGSTVPGTHLALDYNGNAYIQESGDGSSNFYQYAPGSSTPVAVPGFSAVSLAAALISSTNSTLLSWAINGSSSYIMQTVDVSNGQLQQPVSLFSSAQLTAFPFVAAVHPASGPEIAMVNVGYDAGQITFFTRTAGVWSGPTYLPENMLSPYRQPLFALAMNNYQGGFKLAYVGSDAQLYYATYSGGAWSAVTPWGSPNINLSNLGQENTVAFAMDAQGNVWYATDASLNELVPGSTTPITVATLPSKPVGLAFDVAGNLCVNLGTTIEKLAVASSFQVSPALPAGLSFNSATGVISGTPIAVSPATNYTVTATTGSGAFTTTVNIQVSGPSSVSYTTPNIYPTSTPIAPLTPVETVNTSVFASTTSGTGLALDYNGNAYIISSSTEIIQYQMGNSFVPLPANSSANIAIAPISASTSTLLSAFNGAFRAMDITNGSFNPPVTICSAQPGGVTIVAAVHPSSGPEIAMINRGYNAGGQLAFVTRTAGTWSTPVLINNAFPGSAMAINNYQGGLKLAYIGTDNNLYYATYSGGAWSVVSPWGTPNIGLSGVTAFALDAQGDVWYGNGTSLNELAPGSTSPLTVATLPSAPNAIAFDIQGNLYVNLGTTIEKLAVINNFQVNPGLPAGLSINSGTGVISGTPTAVVPAANYTVSATAGSSNLTAAVNIQTITTPSLSYGVPVNATVGAAITTITPTSGSISAQKYNSTPTTFASVTSPTGVAVDAAGNVYVADNSNNIDKFAPGSVLATSLGNGYSPLATDGVGNFYFTNLTTTTLTGIYQFSVIPPGSTSVAYGSPPTAPLTGNTCTGISIDAAGNAYVSTNDGNESVIEYTDGFPINAQANPFAIGNGFSSASGVATDAAGNVYVSDAGAGTIDVIPASRAQWTTLATGLGAPANICIDGAGNLYYSDNIANTISELPVGSTTPVLIASGLGTIKALAIDGKGNLYAADYTNNVIDRFSPTGGYYINPVLPPGLSFNGSTGGISGTPTAPTTAGASVNYTVTAYNTLGSASAVQSLAVIAAPPVVSYGGVQSFNIGKAITPLTPASTGVAAQGYNPVPGFMDFQFGAPYAVAVDTSLNVFVADPYNFGTFAVSSDFSPGYYRGNKCFAKGRGPYVQLPGEVYNYGLFCVATDSTGNIFYTIRSQAKKLSPFPAMAVNQAYDNAPVMCISTDSHGNVFGASPGNGTVLQLISNTPTTIASGFITPTGIAVDGLGNIFVGDRGNNTLYKIPAGSSTPIAVATGFNAPYQLAADGTGNIFIGDGGNGVVKELPAGGGPVITVIPNLKTPNGVAVDVNGALYVADAGFAQVRKYTPSGGYYISPSLPAGLSFNNTTGVISGTPTVITPVKDYRITAYNASGSTQTTLRFGVTPPSSALANLAVSTGALSPAFATATTGYAVSVPYATQQIAITPTAVDGNATVTVNGAAVAYGSTSAPIALQVGANTISIVVTASDHSSTKTYTITVNRAAPSSNALLSSAGIGYVIVGGNIEAVVTPATADPTAAVTVNGVAVASGSQSSPIPLAPGSNTIIITVTAQNGVSKLTYKITVEGPLSAISTLSSLTISAGTLSPVFSGSTTSYTDIVNNSVTAVTVTPTTSDPNATVSVNGAIVNSGTASGNIALSVGNTIIPTVVTAQDGVTSTTYTITVTRPSNNANLANMQLSAGTLNPVFASGTTNYTASVVNSVSSVTVTPTISDASATIKVNGTTVNSGTASGAIPLSVGANIITTIVTAQDGSTTKTYTITVTRMLPANANLANLTISASTLTPAFVTATTSYTASVANSATSITLTPKASDALATIKVNGTSVNTNTSSGAIPLIVGNNVISVVVTAQNGTTTKTYTITVTRMLPANPNLSNLTLSAGTLTPVFATATTSYSASVANPVSSITVTPKASDALATIKVNGTAVSTNTASGAIPLNAGNNLITIIVTAENGIATKTYTVTVTRAPSTNAYLSNLSLSSGNLTPVFASATASYSASVVNSVTSVTVTPATSDATATITVNGTSVNSGTASGAIALSAGTNTITTVVTAQDGVTTKTYTVTVNRLSNNANLAGLAITTGTLSPVFTSGTTSYNGSVVNSVTSVTVTPTTSDATATLTVNGTAVSSGTASGAIALNVGPNTITTVV
ncbi:cadherin-like beta sandwich domain-containing protein, partial [Mucilaginibacter gotjawali]